MQRRLLFWLAVLTLIGAACQGPPPTQIILVVTATPLPDESTTAQIVPTEIPVEISPTVEPTAELPATVTPKPSPVADVVPTPTITQIQLAEQVYEHGRMFWLQPTGQIWVMIVKTEGRGDWQVYEDTFVDGEPEFDPDIVPPDGMEQPKRGFGKLWRENPQIRDELGWAITPEFGYVSRYEYHPGGEVNANNQYVPGPGYHILLSLYEEAFRFNEADHTWQLN